MTDRPDVSEAIAEVPARRISLAWLVPLIAFGGIFRWSQLMDGFMSGADAVAVANQLHYTEHAAKKAKKFLQESGIKIREVS